MTAGYLKVKVFEDMFIRFDKIHERHRQTDGQTDRRGKKTRELYTVFRKKHLLLFSCITLRKK